MQLSKAGERALKAAKDQIERNGYAWFENCERAEFRAVETLIRLGVFKEVERRSSRWQTNQRRRTGDYHYRTSIEIKVVFA